MALKRVCDITGTDRDVEICDVTIAGQTIKLDLAPAGAEKLREFFGPVVTVQHPLEAAAQAPAAEAEAAAGPAPAQEVSEAEEAAATAEEAAAETAPVVAERPARRGRRGAGAAKSAPKPAKAGRKKATPRRGAKPVTPGTSEIREWARANGYEVGERGAIPGRIRSAYTLAHE